MALGTLTIQDAAGGFSVVCTGVTLQKVPDRVFDRTGTNLTYTLLATTITEQYHKGDQLHPRGCEILRF